MYLLELKETEFLMMVYILSYDNSTPYCDQTVSGIVWWKQINFKKFQAHKACVVQSSHFLSLLLYMELYPDTKF